jgi:hypothetical protein
LIATVPLAGDVTSIDPSVKEHVRVGFINASLPVQPEDIDLSAGRNRESGEWRVTAILQVLISAPSGSEAESWAQLAAEKLMGPPHLLEALGPQEYATTYDLVTVLDPDYMTTVLPYNTTEAPAYTWSTTVPPAETTLEPKASVFLAGGTKASELPAITRKEIPEDGGWGLWPSLIVFSLACVACSLLLRTAWVTFAKSPGLPYYVAWEEGGEKSEKGDFDPSTFAKSSKSSRSSDASDDREPSIGESRKSELGTASPEVAHGLVLQIALVRPCRR